jgi:hypothetical protein
MNYDLVVVYRICPKISKIPAIHPTDKYELSRVCLESFKNAIKELRVKMYVVLDNCPKEYEELFKNNFTEEDLVLIPTKLGNKGTFKKQIEILLNQDDSEIVYFAEDDYFYIKNIKKMVDFLKSGKADFVTPYEHPDCYVSDHVIKNKITIFENQRYVTVQHACLTFMTTKKNLLKYKKYLLIFSDWFGSDFVVWGCLTLGWNYFKYLKLIFNFKNFTVENFKVFGVLWFFAWHRFIFNRRSKLFMPVQTFATHMESDFLAPCVDWDYYFNDSQ